LLAFLIEHDDALAGVGDFGGGDEARQSPADHDHVRIIGHLVSPGPIAIEACGVTGGQRQKPARPRSRLRNC
jgi:hypothetical protein